MKAPSADDDAFEEADGHLKVAATKAKNERRNCIRGCAKLTLEKRIGDES
jgi:hypothetical protein